MSNSPVQQLPISPADSTLLVHVAFHYVAQRRVFIDAVLQTLFSYRLKSISIVVDTNSEETAHILDELAIPEHCSVRMDVHSALRDPMRLTWAGREHIEAAYEQFDYAMYVEDDIAIPWATLEKWLSEQGKVGAEGYILGFLRVEEGVGKGPVSSDWPRPSSHNELIHIAGRSYIRPERFYQACWVYSRADMRTFVQGPAWKNGFHPWSAVVTQRVVRDHRAGLGNMIREYSAFGMQCGTPGRHRVILPVDESARVPRDAWVWHLPNNYAVMPNVPYGKLLVSEIVDSPQTRSAILRTLNRVGEWLVEGCIWALYCSRLLKPACAMAERVSWKLDRRGVRGDRCALLRRLTL
jgi:hypothetical protein